MRIEKGSAVMPTNPIEFMGEEPGHDVPRTEFGGDDGLIQGEQPARLKGDPNASGGHVLDDGPDRQVVSERAGIVARVAMEPLVGSEQSTGVSLTGEELRDPVTGRVLLGGGMPMSGGAPGELDGLRITD